MAKGITKVKFNLKKIRIKKMEEDYIECSYYDTIDSFIKLVCGLDIEQLLIDQNPIKIAAGIGMITVLCTIPAAAKLFRESEKVAELDKLQYLNENGEKLFNYRNYHNALSGLRKGVAEHFRNAQDPYCILDIDEYEKKDLEKMMDNIEKEESFGFTYKKRTSGTAKK